MTPWLDQLRESWDGEVPSTAREAMRQALLVWQAAGRPGTGMEAGTAIKALWTRMRATKQRAPDRTMTDPVYTSAADKVASILKFIGQPLTEDQKKAMPHVLTLAAPHSTGDSAYWPDAADPLAQRHGRDKLDDAFWTNAALVHMVLTAQGDHVKADAVVALHGDRQPVLWNDGYIAAKRLVADLPRGLVPA